MKEMIGHEQLKEYVVFLEEEERSSSTIEKYTRDIRAFLLFTGGQEITKNLVISYKEKLKAAYAPASINSMLVAINGFLQYLKLQECCVNQLKIQKRIFQDEQKELTKAEYMRLLKTAENRRNERLFLLLQTICATGIRVGELKFVTAEAIEQGKAAVDNKGKNRIVFLPGKLCKALKKYRKKRGITTGSIFVTRTGKPLDRSNIWKEMKGLCEEAGVSVKKVFPHNLRHLFARCYYAMHRDIARLADILGHSSIDTTRVYMVSTGSEHRSQIEQLKLACMNP